jgi:hypothetical protein
VHTPQRDRLLAAISKDKSGAALLSPALFHSERRLNRSTKKEKAAAGSNKYVPSNKDVYLPPSPIAVPELNLCHVT